MRRSWWLAVGALVTVVATACGGGDDESSSSTTTSSSSTTTTTSSTTTTTAAPTTTTTTAPRDDTCLVGSLAATIGEPDAGAGQRNATLVFTNNGPQPCTMFGYIGMQLLGGGEADLPTNVVRTPGDPTLVTIPPGGQASTTLQWGAIAGEGDNQNGECQPNPVQVEITPPNNTAFLVQPWTGGPVCERGTINTTPVVLGANPSA